MKDHERRLGGGVGLRHVGRALLLVLLALMSLVFASRGGAFVYYGDTNHYAIGRAGLGGESPLDPFVGSRGFDVLPCGVAVDGRYVYWGNKINGTIGRARLDGTGAPVSQFIVGASEPCGLAVYGGHLFWVNQAMDGSIGRANLRGPLDVHENFVPSEQGSGRSDLQEPCGVAVDATGIYWTDNLGASVGHANLDGTGERTLIAGRPAQGCGIALAGGYVYWSYDPYVGAGSIGRALESGLAPDDTYITGLGGACGLASYAHYLYFANGSTIDRTDLLSANPTAATEQIVLGTNFACGVAVDSLYAGTLRILAQRSTPGGGVRITVSVSNPGTITVAESGRSGLLRRLGITLHHAGTTTLTLRPTGTAQRRLKGNRRMRANIVITYTPMGGIDTVKTAAVVLTRG